MRIKIKTIKEMKKTEGVYRDDYQGLPSLKREDGCHFQICKGRMASFCGGTFKGLKVECGDTLIKDNRGRPWWIPPFAFTVEEVS